MPPEPTHPAVGSALPNGLDRVYPHGSELGPEGELRIGGCDVREVAAEFGTPAYVYAEDDMRERAQATMRAYAERFDDFEVLFASKAFPCTAALRIFADEGLSFDCASGGELHIALTAGVDPERIYFHGNNKSEAELALAASAGVGYVIVDSLDEIDRLERVLGTGSGQRVLLRVTPGIEPETHTAIRTGQEDSKFGLPMRDVERAMARADEIGLVVRGVHGHIGSQVVDTEIYESLADVLHQIGDYPLINMGGGFAIAYTREDRPPPVEEFAQAMRSHAPAGTKILCEPGRSLVGNAGVTLYRVGTVKEIPGVRTYVAVDGGMADNIRPMLYGSVYEADVADRFGDSTPCRLVGMHCESGDVLVADAALEDPRVGDLVVTPATGAYGHAMASNYNGVPRPPVVFCAGGDARLVVRRETYDDLTRRDVE